jgi:hypothetical protein
MQLIASGYLTPSRIKDFCKDPAYFFDQYVGDLAFTPEQLQIFADSPAQFLEQFKPAVINCLADHLRRELRKNPGEFFFKYATSLELSLSAEALSQAKASPTDLTNIRPIINVLLPDLALVVGANPALLFTTYAHDLLRQIGKRTKDPRKWPTKHIATLIGTGAHAALQYAHQKRMTDSPFTMEEVKAAALAGYFHDLAETYPEPDSLAANYLDNLLRIGYLRDVNPTMPSAGTPEYAEWQKILLDANHDGLPIAAAWRVLEEVNTNQNKDLLDPRIDTRKDTSKARNLNPQTITFGHSDIQTLEEGEKVVLAAARSIVRRLIPDEAGEKRIVSVERKLNYTGILPFQFYGRIDGQAQDGTLKDLKTTASKVDKWAKFQLLCYGLVDFFADPQNPTLDPIQIDQLAKDDEMHITTLSYYPTREDYQTVHQMVLQAGEQVHLMSDLVTYDPVAFQALLDEYAIEFVARKTLDVSQFTSDLPVPEADQYVRLLTDHSLVLVAAEAVEPLHLVEDLPNQEAVHLQKYLDDYGVVLVARESVKPLLLVSAAPAAHDHEFPDLLKPKAILELTAPTPEAQVPSEPSYTAEGEYKFPDLLSDVVGKSLTPKYKLEFLLPPVKKGEASTPSEAAPFVEEIEAEEEELDLIL